MAIHVINDINSRLRLNVSKRKKVKTRLQATQNKCQRFCLKLNGRSSIKSKDSEKNKLINVLLRIVLAILIRYNVIIEANGVHMCSSNQKLNVPCRKTNVGQKGLSYIGVLRWKNLNKTLKTSTSLNAFKNKIKQLYFHELN